MSDKKVTWPKLIGRRMTENNESLDDIISFKTKSNQEDWLNISFKNSFGSHEGLPFVIWTKKFIYFNAVYDGLTWVESIPRNPDDTFMPRGIGGGGLGNQKM